MKTPTTFERNGTAYVGYALALANDFGEEIIIIAPSIDGAVMAANHMGHKSINRDKIQQVDVSRHIGDGS